MSRLKDKLVIGSTHPVLATLVASFLEKQEQETKKLSEHRKRTYTNILPAIRNGVSINSLKPVFNKSLNEAIMEACAVDVNGDYKQESFKRYLQTYITTI